LRKTDCGQLLKYAGLQSTCERMRTDKDEDEDKKDQEDQEGKARRHACRTQASITAAITPIQNQYLVSVFTQ
jgi:hypothetical protein